MPRKPKPPPDDPEQFKRFTDMAREVGADTDPETLGRVFDKVARPSKPRPGRAGSARGSKKTRDRSR
jgi:hypothetical protein